MFGCITIYCRLVLRWKLLTPARERCVKYLLAAEKKNHRKWTYTLLVYLRWRIYRVNVQTPAKRNLVKGCKRITFVKHTNCIIQGGDNTWWLTNDRPYLPGNLRGQKNTPHPTLFPRVRYPFRIFAFATFII